MAEKRVVEDRVDQAPVGLQEPLEDLAPSHRHRRIKLRFELGLPLGPLLHFDGVVRPKLGDAFVARDGLGEPRDFFWGAEGGRLRSVEPALGGGHGVDVDLGVGL